jgi:hypothetical protein
MGYHTRIALTPKQSKQAKPSTRFTPEPPRVQTQMQRTPPALPKLHPNTSIFETDLNNPHRGLFGSFGASLRHAVSHDSNSGENHTGAPDVQTKRLSYPWEHFDPSNPSAYLFGSAAPSTASHQPIQAKLAVGAVGDKYEQEADAVAAQVVTQINAPERMQREQDESQMQPEALQQKGTGEDSALQRLQRREMSEAEERQRPSEGQSVGLEGGPVSTNFEAELQGAKGHGQALDPNLQASMGQAMGADFSGVKVHTDTQSDQLNQSIQAKAFTTGQDVFFRQGEYQPESRSGQELIAHELTHVVQQDCCRDAQAELRNTNNFVQRTVSNETFTPQQPVETILSVLATKKDSQGRILKGKYQTPQDLDFKTMKTLNRAEEVSCEVVAPQLIKGQKKVPWDKRGTNTNEYLAIGALGKWEGMARSAELKQENDVGHLVADIFWNQSQKADAYVAENLAPESNNLNRGTWKSEFENIVKSEAEKSPGKSVVKMKVKVTYDSDGEYKLRDLVDRKALEPTNQPGYKNDLALQPEPKIKVPRWIPKTWQPSITNVNLSKTIPVDKNFTANFKPTRKQQWAKELKKGKKGEVIFHQGVLNDDPEAAKNPTKMGFGSDFRLTEKQKKRGRKWVGTGRIKKVTDAFSGLIKNQKLLAQPKQGSQTNLPSKNLQGFMLMGFLSESTNNINGCDSYKKIIESTYNSVEGELNKSGLEFDRPLKKIKQEIENILGGELSDDEEMDKGFE